MRPRTFDAGTLQALVTGKMLDPASAFHWRDLAVPLFFSPERVGGDQGQGRGMGKRWMRQRSGDLGKQRGSGEVDLRIGRYGRGTSRPDPIHGGMGRTTGYPRGGPIAARGGGHRPATTLSPGLSDAVVARKFCRPRSLVARGSRRCSRGPALPSPVVERPCSTCAPVGTLSHRRSDAP